MKPTFEGTAAWLEDMILDDPAGRGVRNFYLQGELCQAAQSLAGGERVIIITGFYILAAGAAESDGPPGAAVLARALRKLGKEVLLVTDPANEAAVEAAVSALKETIPIKIFTPEAVEEEYREFLYTWRPTHVVAVERPGRSSDGCFYTMRADDISAMTASLDWLILLANEIHATTIGMGDGGNEIGMGKVRDQVVDGVPFGDIIACSVPTSFVLTAGVTNWAAYALTTLLSIISKQNLLHNPGEEQAMLAAMTQVGCVDGNLCRPAESIDAVSLADHQARILIMKGLLHEHGIVE